MVEITPISNATLPVAWRRILVVGLGRTGLAVVAALANSGRVVIAVDERGDATEAGAQAQALGAEVHLGADPTTWVLGDGVEAVGVVVPSPGVSEHAPVLQMARDQGVPVISEPELGWLLAPRELVVITGTNGKTSVTELTTAMLQASGITAHACGNIGDPLVEVALASDPDDVLVAELSSFQLRFCDELTPRVGVLLNLAEDHLDWHGSVAAYGAAKAQMWAAQTDHDWAVIPFGDATATGLAVGVAGKLCTFTTSGTRPLGVGSWVADGVLRVVRPGGEVVDVIAVDELSVQAPHHLANVAAAALAALLMRATPAGIRVAARAYLPGHHRLEVVAEAGGVRWVDDSKATNPHATAAALAAFGSIIWICGGLAKGVDLSLLSDHLGNVKAARCIGTAAPALVTVCTEAGVDAVDVGDLERAVLEAAALAEPGDTVLLAPACSSFDQFRDYRDRGEQFARLALAASARTSS